MSQNCLRFPAENKPELPTRRLQGACFGQPCVRCLLQEPPLLAQRLGSVWRPPVAVCCSFHKISILSPPRPPPGPNHKRRGFQRSRHLLEVISLLISRDLCSRRQAGLPEPQGGCLPSPEMVQVKAPGGPRRGEGSSYRAAEGGRSLLTSTWVFCNPCRAAVCYANSHSFEAPTWRLGQIKTPGGWGWHS